MPVQLPNYRPRVVDAELAALLQSSGAVVVEGAKACGKTETARRVAASEVLLDLDMNARRAMAVEPTLVLAGANPRLIDEWQVEPAIWNYVRRAVDAGGVPGQFILTGSAIPADDVTRHTGAGRIARLRMRPLSLFEQGQSTGEISLSDLLRGSKPRCPDTGTTVQDLAAAVSVGGWPANLATDTDKAMRAVRHYLDEICRADISRVDGISRDPGIAARLMRSLARNSATYAAATTLAADAGDPEEGMAAATARSYLAALERLMIVENQPAWAPHLRSRSTLRLGPKRHFVDPALAVAALRTGPERLLRDLELLGFLYESLVIRDLRVYAQAMEATVLQYRDNTGLEVDAIVECVDGTWAAFEVKLSAAWANDAAANLLRFRERVDVDRCGQPAALAVIVGNGYGYRREDGVDVIPIGALGP